MKHGTLESLLARYRESRDEDALSDLVRRTRPALLRVAARIAPSDAEDCVQVAYVSLLHRRHGPKDIPVMPWLVRVVTRVAYRHYALSRRLPRVADRLARPLPPPSAAREALEAEERTLLRRRLDRLAARYRDPIVLHYLEGLSTRETAHLLGLTREATKKRLQRGRALLLSKWHSATLGLFLPLASWGWKGAGTAATGGLVMKKKAAVVIALLIALTATAIGVQWNRHDAPATRRSEAPSRDDAARSATSDPAGPALIAESGEITPDDPDPSWRGVVVDRDGKAVAGARVTILRYFSPGRMVDIQFSPGRSLAEYRQSVRTREDGTFILEPTIPAGSRIQSKDLTELEVRAAAEGFVPSRSRIRRDTPARLVLGSGGQVNVRVRDEDGHPLGGARIEGAAPPPARPMFMPGSSRPVATADTDASGWGRLVLPPGRWRIYAHAPGHRGGTAEVTVEEDGRHEAQLVLDSLPQVVLAVVDPSGLPVEGATVRFHPWRSPTDVPAMLMAGMENGVNRRTNAAGHCTAPWIRGRSKLEESGLRYTVVTHGYPAVRGSFLWASAPKRIRVTLTKAHPVVVRVLDADGQPLPKAIIQSTRDLMHSRGWGDLRVETDAQGRAELPPIRPGSYRVFVMHSAPGTVSRWFRIQVGPNPVEHTVKLSRSHAAISGVILDPKGNPVRGGRIGFVRARVTLYDTQAHCRARIQGDGTFRIKVPYPGAGTIVAVPDGYGFQAWPLEVRADEQRNDVRLRVPVGVEVAGRAVDRAGRPLPGISIELGQQWQISRQLPNKSRQVVASTRTDRAGRFRLGGLKRETYQLRASADAWIPIQARDLDVDGGQEDVTVRMKPREEGLGQRIEVRARFDGAPKELPAIRAFAITPDKRQGLARWNGTPARGVTAAFRYLGSPGTVSFRFEAKGYRPAAVPNVEVREVGPTPVDVVFRRGAVLRLVLKNAKGEPLVQRRVFCNGIPARTDRAGVCEVGGFDPGKRDIRVTLGNSFTRADAQQVSIPGTVSLVLRKHALITVLHLNLRHGRDRKAVRWRLLRSDGEVAAAAAFDPADPQPARPSGYPIRTDFAVTEGGEYTVEATVDGKIFRRTVRATLGRDTSVYFR